MTNFTPLSVLYDKQTPDFPTLREKIAAETKTRKERYAFFTKIWREATAAGDAAATAHVPIPMVVAEHTNVLDPSSAVKKAWHVHGGVCGFAEVKIPGNTSFAHWAKKNAGFKAAYPKGLSYWVHGYGQSMERKAKFASVVARYLRDNGIEACCMSRMD